MTESAAVPAPRQPNERLLSLIRDAGCSNAGLARRVNVCAGERGLDFRYDKTSVARWIRGQRPRGRAPEIIAEALGRKLGRTVHLQEIGMGGSRHPASAVGLTFAVTLPEALEEARELWRADAARPVTAGSGPPLPGGPAPGPAQVPPGALVEPSRDWLIARVDESAAAIGTGRVGAADVEAVLATSRALADLDRRWGAGHIRPVLAHYLNGVVGSLLAGSYRDAVGRRLYGAAARLSELAGYMAVDTGRPGLAQRYYIQALRLSQAAGDRAFGGYVLAAGMSHLAALLGSPREVIQLARAAQEGTRGQAPPRAAALFLAAEARGHAQLGDREACRQAASRALTAMDQAHSADREDPEWIRHFDAAYLADELAHCHRDLDHGVAAQQRAAEALSGYPESHARRRAIGLLLLATGRLQQGEVDHACQTAGEAGVLLAGLRSRRGADYFADFTQRLAPYQNAGAVREFQERWPVRQAVAA
jgi:hypothetical protein